MSFVLTFAMALGSVPTDGIAYAAITNGAKTPQVETKVETPETPATTPTAGVVAETPTAPAIDEAKPKTVKVRFDANGGEGYMDDFEVTLNGGDWSVAETPFTRDGYCFVGWGIAADVAKGAVDDPETDIDESLTGVLLADKQEFVDLMSQKRDDDGNVVETHDFGKYVSDDVLTLYAQWEKVETVEVSEPVVDENDVAKAEENVDEVGSDETVDTNVVEDDVIDDTTSDKELDKELLSGAFGNKTDGGVADKIGTSNPLSRKLTAPLMAAAAPSLTTQASPTGSRAGTAYAVLDSAGTLTFFRSTNTYTAGTGKTVKDVTGKTYTGRVYTGVENTDAISPTASPWYSQRSSIKLVKIADGQVIAPKTCTKWFSNCSYMTAFGGAERLDTSAVTDMYGMFQNCKKLAEPPSVGSWDTSAVTSMIYMFRGCTAMTEPPSVGSWNTSKVTSMYRMFQGCSKMTEPPAVGGWHTSVVTDMDSMFSSCSKMTSLDVSGWDFSKVTSESNYLGLQNCSALKELKVPAGAKITGLPEHSAQGDYGTTWGNADRGITGSTAANLMSVVNAGNGAGTWTWEQAAAEYTVNFMVDGSSTAMQAERVKADEDYVVPSCEVTKLYHDFVEWSGSDGNTYHAGDTVTAGTFAAGETLTLTAVFAPHEYGPGEFDGNLQLTVPASINFVVEPDGTLTGPSNASIVNTSGVNTRVSSVEVKELGNFNFVANAEASGEQNAVELRFGPLSDMLDAASFLSKSGVDDSAWAMGTATGQNTVQLETEGKVAHVGVDIAKVNKFGEVRWFVKAVD